TQRGGPNTCRISWTGQGIEFSAAIGRPGQGTFVSSTVPPPGQESGSSAVDTARRRGRQSWAGSSPAAPTRAHSAHGRIAYTAPPMTGPAPVPIVYAAPYNPW